MKNKNLFWVMVIAGALISGILLGSMMTARAFQRDSNAFNGMFNGKLENILSLIENQYVDTVNIEQLSEETITDLLAKLDPHSVYIPARDLQMMNDEIDGSFSGIGVQFNIQNDTVMIISVISGGPSQKVGLLAGDRIVSVDDSSFVGKNINNERVVRKLRGVPNSKVKLGIKRLGTREILKYNITRGEIPVSSIDIAYMIQPQIGFIKINKFGEKTYDEFVNALNTLKKQGASRFIIDLRENSGGLLDQATKMINELLPANQMIVYSEGNAYPRKEEISDGTGKFIKNPVVILIDEFSASASEIFAGAIQDNDRGTIIGRRSFGKGLVQQQIDLFDHSAIRLTVARYYTPSGRCIQKPYEKGQTEDYENEIINRFIKGDADKNTHAKNEKSYKTLKGRTVYAGGGIMPDIYVTRDTSEYTPYLNQVMNYGYLYQFAFYYSDKNRSTLSAIKSWKKMESHLDAEPLVNDFISFAEKKGIKANSKQINISKNIIERHIKAYIIRNMLGDEGFYPIFMSNDPIINKAIEVIKKK